MADNLQALYGTLDRIGGPAKLLAQHFRSIDSSANRAAQAVAKIAPTGLVSPKGVTLVRSLDGKVRDLRGRFVALGGAVGKAGARTDGFVNGALNAYELLKRSSAIGTMFSAVSGAASVGVDAVGRFISTTVELNSAVESTRIAVAGMLQVGGATGSWAESMQVAESVMQRIRVHAAALPGEADDFVQIFRTGLPKALEAGLDVSKAEDLAANFGAVGITLGINVPQIGKDLNRLLSGAASAGTPMWRAMSASISSAARSLGLTVRNAKEFNKLDPADRARVLQVAVSKYSPMIEAFGDTWEAVSSTFVSDVKEMVRVAGFPLFERIKNSLKDMNERLAATSPLGRVLRGTLNGLANVVTSLFTMDSGRMNALFQTVIPVVVRLISLVGRFLFPVIRAVTRGLIDGFTAAAPALDAVMSAMGSTRPDVGAWQALGSMLGKLAVLAVGFAVVFVRGATYVSNAITTMTQGVTFLYNSFVGVGGSIVQGLFDGFSSRWEAVKQQLLSFVGELPASVKSFLGIHSPSRVFMQLGANTAEGFRLGVERGGDGTQEALRAAVSAPRSSSAPRASRSAAPITVNVSVDGSRGESSELAELIAARVRAELSAVLGSAVLETA